MPRVRMNPEQRREHILDVAIDCFAEFGPSVSTAKIARAAQVSEGLLFHYFPKKQDLWIAAGTRTGSFAVKMRGLFENLGKGPIEEELGQVAEDFGSVLVKERKVVAIFFGAAFRDEAMGAFIREGHEIAAQRLGNILEQRGVLRAGVDPKAAAIGFLGGFVMFFLMYHRETKEQWARDARGFAANWVHIWCRGAVRSDEDE